MKKSLQVKKFSILAAVVSGIAVLVLFSFEGPPGGGPGREGPPPGWVVEIKGNGYAVGENEVLFSVLDSAGEPLVGPLVTVTVRGPDGQGGTSGGFYLGDGVYRAGVRFSEPGQWDLSVYVFLRGQSVTHEEQVVVREQ